MMTKMHARACLFSRQVFIFLGETFLSMNWAIVADILLVGFLFQKRHIQTTLAFLKNGKTLHNHCLNLFFVSF